MFKSSKVLVCFQRVSIFLFLIFGISLVQSKPAYAQIGQSKIFASDGSAGDDYGWSVAISGDYAIVGDYTWMMIVEVHQARPIFTFVMEEVGPSKQNSQPALAIAPNFLYFISSILTDNEDDKTQLAKQCGT